MRSEIRVVRIVEVREKGLQIYRFSIGLFCLGDTDELGCVNTI